MVSEAKLGTLFEVIEVWRAILMQPGNRLVQVVDFQFLLADYPGYFLRVVWDGCLLWEGVSEIGIVVDLIKWGHEILSLTGNESIAFFYLALLFL